MKTLPLEDNFRDVIAKAQLSRGLSDAALAGAANIEIAVLRDAENEMPNDDALRNIATVLGLNADALVALAHEKIMPPAPAIADGFAMFTTDYREGITVNNYLVWSPATGEAALFDTGTNIRELTAAVREKNLFPKTLFLTHAHPDHIAAIDAVRAAFTGIRIRIDAREPLLEDVKTFVAGARFAVGNLTIETRDVAGHSPGQTAFVVAGLPQPLAVVGDSVFAASMGRAADCFAQQHANNRNHIFTLSDETILAPGHGPATTVGFEKKNNPFFAKS